jgi:hypothetical protein
MQTFNYLEDYIEFMAGLTSNIHSGGAVLGAGVIPFNLARYDKAPVENMSSQTYFGTALTDKQAKLCQRIVLNYRKQFAKNGIDVSPMETSPNYRMPLRTIDRTKSAYIEDKSIILKFPYAQDLINELRDYKGKSDSRILFQGNGDIKAWVLGITEQNVAWVVGWGKLHDFEVSKELIEMDKQVQECEGIEYKIELVETEDGYTITNAEDSLVNYINEKHGGFGKDNVQALTREAGTLGYTISDKIREQLPETIREFAGQRVVHIKPKEHDLKTILAFADATNRWPVYMFDPHSSHDKQLDELGLAEDEIVRFDLRGKTATCDYNVDNVKLMYAGRIPKTWVYKLPLFVSTTNLPHSNLHQRCLANAEVLIEYFDQKL